MNGNSIVKPGRPKKEDLKLKNRIEIRLSDRDIKMINRISEKDKISKSAVIRRAIFNDYTYFHYSRTDSLVDV